jgi:protein-serine/threonine kinase
LKPENVLLDKSGYIKLTDFGLSKALLYEDEKAMTICGTPEYLAPEVIKKQGHNKAVDWWCLGCIIYEMVTGFPPYRSQNRMELFESILYQPLLVPKVRNMIFSVLPNCRIYYRGYWKRIPRTDWGQTVLTR